MKKIPSFNLRLRLLFLIMIVIIPGLILAVYTLIEERQWEETQLKNNAIRLANLISIQEQDLIEAGRNLLVVASKIPRIGIGRTQNYSPFLAHLLHDFPRHSNFGIADTNGNVIANAVISDKKVNVANRNFFRTAMETGKFAIGGYKVGRILGNPEIVIAYPIVNENGKKLGVIFSSINFRKLDILESRVGIQLPQGWTLRKIDKDGILLMQYPNTNFAIGRPVPKLSRILPHVNQEQGIFIAPDSVGKSQLFAYSRLKSKLFSTEILVILSVPEEYAFLEINHHFYRNLIFLFISGLLILLVGAVVNEIHLVRGLNSIQNAAIQLSLGNLQTRVKHFRGLIEVRKLGETFNEMISMIEQREFKRQQVEEELHKKEKSLAKAEEVAGFGNWVFFLKENIIHLSDGAKKIYGLEKNLLSIEELQQIPLIEYRPTLDKVFNDLIENNVPYEDEYKIRRLTDGKIIDIHAIAEYDSSNNNVFGVIQDVTERKLAEQKLREAELRYRTLFELSPDGIVILDPETARFIEFNQAAYNQLHYSFEEFSKLSLSDIDIDETHDQTMSHISKILNDKEGNFETRHSTKLGEVRNIHVKVKIIEIFGHPIYYCIWQDITERKRFEEALQKMAKKYRMTFENTGTATILIEKDTTLSLVNAEFEKLSGYTKTEIEGKKKWTEFIVKEDRAYLIAFYKLLREDPEAAKKQYGEINRQLEFRFVNRFGTIHNIILFAGIIEDTTTTIASLMDITHRKRMEEELNRYKDHLLEMVEERTAELEQSRETFRALAENTKDVIIRVDDRFQFLYVNSTMKDVAGIIETEYIGKTISELSFPQDIVEKFETMLKKVFETKQNQHIEFHMPSGNWGDLIAVPEFDINGNVCTSIISARDITELKKLQLEIQNALVKEKELNKLKSNFISMVSHEFRTPLATLLSSSDFLESSVDTMDDAKKVKYFNRIRKNIDHMTYMLEEVLFINKMDSEKLKVTKEKINLRHFCTEIFEEISELFPYNKSNLQINTENEYYNIDAELLRKILENLISNAFKYNIENGEVTLNVNSKRNRIIFDIIDAGIGIPEDEQIYVFQSFTRMSNSQKIKGSGLGLNIAKRAVEKLGGEISFVSKENKGTTFTVVIPVN